MFSFEKSKTEKIRLLNGFPSAIQQDVEEVVKMLTFDRNVLLVDTKSGNLDTYIHSTEQIVSLNGEILK